MIRARKFIRTTSLACVVLTVLAAGGWYAHRSIQTSDEFDAGRLDATHRSTAPHGRELPDGPWGRLTFRTMMLAPPAEPPASREIPHWIFEKITAPELADFFARLELSDRQFKHLLQAVQPQRAIDGYVATPPGRLVRSLTPDARATLYNHLGLSPRNPDQVNAYRCWLNSPKDWLADTGLSQDTRRLVEPLIYRNGHMLFFADLPTVLRQIDQPQQRRRLRRALARERTLRLRLRIAPQENIEPMVAYWGVGGREARIRSILQPLADRAEGGEVDVVRLLPPFARQRLYTYPRRGMKLPEGQSRDCHWSALNFFNARPDDRLADIRRVDVAMHVEHRPVKEPRFGDVVVLESGGEIFHSATYIAAGIVMTRNGQRDVRPWMLLPLRVMKDFYPGRAPVAVRYLRRAPARASAWSELVPPQISHDQAKRG